MAGTGVELRMQILRDAAEQQIIKPLRTHGWQVSVLPEFLDGEYLIITATKADATRKLALLYTTAIANSYYKRLDKAVDRIFINGELYKPESYAYGISTPVEPISDFFPTLVQWNKEIVPEVAAPRPPLRVRKTITRHITSERPLDGIWARLDQFGSVTVAKKLVIGRAEAMSLQLSSDAADAKAAGVAFSLRNASDYFRSVPHESLNKRILSLYYGTLALAFAEMLASPNGPSDLDEVEGMTKLGHGLYTLPSASRDFGSLNVGVLASGFFPHWVSFLGYDTAAFPRGKPKTPTDLDKDKFPRECVTTLRGVLAAIPELAELFLTVFEDAPSWIVPVYSFEANPRAFSLKKVECPPSTYITLVDPSRRITPERIQTAGWPLAEVTQTDDEPQKGRTFRVRVDHPGFEYWHEALPIHRSPFEARMTLIVPPLAGIVEYRVVALTVLYALSIMVRYMPSAWRRVEGGDWDQHLVLVRTALNVFERLLPEQFLESITGEHVYVRQPGSFV